MRCKAVKIKWTFNLQKMEWEGERERKRKEKINRAIERECLL